MGAKRQSAAARILGYFKTAEIAEAKVVLDLAKITLLERGHNRN